VLKHGILFGLGGIFYVIIELLWRGNSHWSMFVLGGLCFLIIGLINEQSRGKIPLILQMSISAVIITVLEFFTGYIVNIRLDMNVWNYSDLPYNIMGQVCLLYTILWFFLSLLCIIADDWLRYRLFGEEKQKYRII
jgi:uncharacterized membrane protein